MEHSKADGPFICSMVNDPSVEGVSCNLHKPGRGTIRREEIFPESNLQFVAKSLLSESVIDHYLLACL